MGLAGVAEWMPGTALLWDSGRFWRGTDRSESYGAISSVERRKSFRWGRGSGMLRGRRMQLGVEGLRARRRRRGLVERASE